MTSSSISKIYDALTLLLSFDHEKIKKLVDLITIMPPEEASHNRGHK
jgi:hypothetical protein